MQIAMPAKGDLSDGGLCPTGTTGRIRKDVWGFRGRFPSRPEQPSNDAAHLV